MDRVIKQLNMDQLQQNLESIKSQLPEKTQLIPIIKANAYGHGLVPIAKSASEVSSVCLLGVAYPEEVRQLNKTDVQTPRLLLSESREYDNEIVTEKTHFTVYTERAIHTLNTLAKANNIHLNVHLKIDTGMHRFGCAIGDLNNRLDLINSAENLILTGVFSHLSSAELPDDTETKKQLITFQDCLDIIKQRGPLPTYCHLYNSAGTQALPMKDLTAVRVGLSIYQDVLSVKTHIKAIQELEAEQPLGYCPAYQSDQSRIIGILEVGYRDGLPTQSSNKSYVLVHGKKAPIVGQVCMDCSFVDLTDIPTAKSGDIATLLGQDGQAKITANDWHQTCQINPREILIQLGVS